MFFSNQQRATKRVDLNPFLIEGEWDFKGYYPEGCKLKPTCFTKKMGFELDRTAGKQESWLHFKTKAELTGDTCPVEHGLFHGGFGNMWMKGNQILNGGGNGHKPHFGAEYLSSPFYIDEDAPQKLMFIKEKQLEDCWIIFEKSKPEEEYLLKGKDKDTGSSSKSKGKSSREYDKFSYFQSESEDP